MKNYLKNYQLTLTVKGPVFVGSGEVIQKNEYFIHPKTKEVCVSDQRKMYQFFVDQGLENEYLKFLRNAKKANFGGLIRECDLSFDQVAKACAYRLSGGDALRKNARQAQVMAIIKDPFGKPYIPGSTLKGMLRTILLASDLIADNRGKYENDYQQIDDNVFGNKRMSRTRFLQRENRSMETTMFHTLNRPKSKKRDMVNDFMSGLLVGDSEPLEMSDCVLCQKIDVHKSGMERELPLFRECLKPGTVIRFPLTIDTTVCKLTSAQILKAASVFAEKHFEHFVSYFNSKAKPKNNAVPDVYLGGGTGFISKTVVYSLYTEHMDGVEATQQIFEKTRVPRFHKHNQDLRLKVSPHVLKCTHYNGQTLQMGLCNMQIK